MMHSQNCFITLTYNNEYLPGDGSLVPRHLTLFFKKFRKALAAFGLKIRFFACGEYGDLNKRPHYHALIFGFQFPDLKKYSQNDQGDDIYTSQILDDLWGMGECKIGSVNFKTAGYVARYSMKKVTGAKRKAGHYEVFDSDGVLTERLPEFARMSMRPGIGTSFYLKYGHQIRAHDFIVVDGKKVPSIRYYDLKFESLDPKGFARVKRRRVRLARYTDGFLVENGEQRRRFKESLKEKLLKMKARKL